MVSGSCEQEPKGGKPYNLSQESKRAATIPCFLEKRDIWENLPEVTKTIRQKKCQGQVFAYCTLVASRNLRQNSERRVPLLGQVRTITNQEKWIASNVQDQQDTN